jgi:hypothetical protein
MGATACQATAVVPRWLGRSRRFGCFSRQREALQKRRKRREGSRAIPLWRRRDGSPIQARTEEQSPDRVRVPARRKAPRSFQRCHPSRGGIRERPRPERHGARLIQTSRRSDSVTRVLDVPMRRARATRPRTARPCLCSGTSAHGMPRPRKWNAGVERPRVHSVARRFPLWQRNAETNATGIGWCRRVAGRKPHSRARVERSSGVPVRR